jgi:hypothetical protein
VVTWEVSWSRGSYRPTSTITEPTFVVIFNYLWVGGIEHNNISVKNLMYDRLWTGSMKIIAFSTNSQ